LPGTASTSRPLAQGHRPCRYEAQRASSVALIKNVRAEGLLLQIETQEAQLARSTAMTTMWSAYQEVAALAQEKARVVGLMVEDSPDNALTRPHFLQARLAAAARVLPVRERTSRRVYLALRALEYELSQELPALREQLATARAPEDFAGKRRGRAPVHPLGLRGRAVLGVVCDDRIDTIEVKLVGDYLGDKEAEVMLTRQGLVGVRRP